MDWSSVDDWMSEQGIWLLVTLLVGGLLFLALRRWMPRLVRSIISGMEVVSTDEELQRLADAVTRVVVWLCAIIIIVAVVIAVLPRFGVDTTLFIDTIGAWLWSHGIVIAIIIVVAVTIHLMARWLIHRIVERSAVREKYRSKVEYQKRIETLSHFFYQVAEVVIWLVALFMILSEFGLDIGPLLAGAGIAGIAIAFGAQRLIRDVLTGFFIIIETPLEQIRKKS